MCFLGIFTFPISTPFWSWTSSQHEAITSQNRPRRNTIGMEVVLRELQSCQLSMTFDFRVNNERMGKTIFGKFLSLAVAETNLHQSHSYRSSVKGIVRLRG